MLVDAHAHVWGSELLDVHWLRADAAAGIRRPFGVEQLECELGREGIDRVVLVAADETDAGNLRLLDGASRSPRVGAVVAWADPADPRVGEKVALLRNAAGGERLRGVRVSAGGAGAAWWWSREVIAGLAVLRDLGLVIEVLTDEGSLPALAAVGRGVAGLTLVVDHLGAPPAEGREQWAAAIRELAAVEGAHLKVSGAPVFADDFADLLGAARRAFGASRLMAGSDWPVSTLHGGDAWRRVVDAASGWSDDERAHLAGRTAARVYGIAA